MTDITSHPPPAPLQALLTVLDYTRVQRDLVRLCAPDLAGRQIGTNGHDQAAAWLSETMVSLGLIVKPFDFTLDVPVLDLSAAPTFVVLDVAGATRQILAHRQDFAEHPASAECEQPITGPAHRSAWVILDTIPSHEELPTLGTQLRHQGAVGMLVPQHATTEGYLSKRVAAVSPIGLPVLTVRADLLPTLDGTLVQAHVLLRRVAARGQIVLGRVDGTDPALAQAPLIVGAHYDGVGDDPGGPRLPGAADNAAGVAVVLELARIVQTVYPSPAPAADLRGF